MDSTQPALKINFQHLTKVLDDNLSTGSFKSGGGDLTLQTQLFFENTAAKVTVPFVESTLSGEYALCDENWGFWLSPRHPNSHKLSDHEKCTVEGLNQVIHHQNTVIQNLEQLREHHQVNRFWTTWGQKWCVMETYPRSV